MHHQLYVGRGNFLDDQHKNNSAHHEQEMVHVNQEQPSVNIQIYVIVSEAIPEIIFV